MRYWVYKDSEILGPVAHDDLPRWREFGAGVLVCPENAAGSREGDWICVADVPELAGLLGAEVLSSAEIIEATLEDAPQSPPVHAEEPEAGESSLLETLGPEWGLGEEGVLGGSKESVGDLAAQRKRAIEDERKYSAEIEGRLDDLLKKLAVYDERQNRILERLKEKDSHLDAAPAVGVPPAAKPESSARTPAGRAFAPPEPAAEPPPRPAPEPTVFIDLGVPEAAPPPVGVPPASNMEPPPQLPQPEEPAPAPIPVDQAPPAAFIDRAAEPPPASTPVPEAPPAPAQQTPPDLFFRAITPMPQWAQEHQGQTPLPTPVPREPIPRPITAVLPWTVGPAPAAESPAPGPKSIERQPITGPLARFSRTEQAATPVPAKRMPMVRRRQSKMFPAVLAVAFLGILAAGAYFLRGGPQGAIQVFDIGPQRKRVADPEEMMHPPAALGKFKPMPAGSRSSPPGAAPVTETPGGDYVADAATKAIGLVQGHPLGGGRRNVLQWLQYSYLQTPGNEDEWTAGAKDADTYFVQYRVFRGGRNARGVEPIIYIFEANAANKKVSGINPAAKGLLAGGAVKSRRPARKPQVRRRPPSDGVVPLLPLP